MERRQFAEIAVGGPRRARAVVATTFGFVVGLVLLGAGAADAEGGVDARAAAGRGARSGPSELGLRAPACELAAYERGTGFSESTERFAFEGRITLVDFWASWCATCERAFGFLNALARDYRDAGLTVLAVNLDTNPSDAVDFLAGRGPRFGIARDASGDCPRGFGLVGMPQAFLVDATGRVRAVTRGFRPGEGRLLRAQIEALLADSPTVLPVVAAGANSANPDASTPGSPRPAAR